MKLLKTFHPHAATTIFFWALAFVLTRLALVYFTPLPLGFIRYAVASAALLIVCIVKKMKLPAKRDLPWFLASGFTGFFMYMIAFNIGTVDVTAATSSVVVSCAPVMTALFASAVFREKLAARQWIAIAVEFAGILVLTLYGAVFTANSGTLWLLLAALMISSYNLIQRRLIKTYSALQVTAYSIFIGTIMLAIFSPEAARELRGAPVMPVVYVVLLGIFSSAVAYMSWAKAFEKAEKTSDVSNYLFFTPFVTGILGFLLAGEIPDVSTWIGGAFIIAGAVMFNRFTPKPIAEIDKKVSDE